MSIKCTNDPNQSDIDRLFLSSGPRALNMGLKGSVIAGNIVEWIVGTSRTCMIVKIKLSIILQLVSDNHAACRTRPRHRSCHQNNFQHSSLHLMTQILTAEYTSGGGPPLTCLLPAMTFPFKRRQKFNHGWREAYLQKKASLHVAKIRPHGLAVFLLASCGVVGGHGL